jgi:hypothetical protein
MILSLSYIQAGAVVLETAKNYTDIPAYLISSREGTSFKGVQGPCYGNYGNYAYLDINNLYSVCPSEIAIFAHDRNANESQSNEQ